MRGTQTTGCDGRAKLGLDFRRSCLEYCSILWKRVLCVWWSMNWLRLFAEHAFNYLHSDWNEAVGATSGRFEGRSDGKINILNNACNNLMQKHILIWSSPQQTSPTTPRAQNICKSSVRIICICTSSLSTTWRGDGKSKQCIAATFGHHSKC